MRKLQPERLQSLPRVNLNFKLGRGREEGTQDLTLCVCCCVCFSFVFVVVVVVSPETVVVPLSTLTTPAHGHATLHHFARS